MPADVILDVDAKFDNIDKQLKAFQNKSININVNLDPGSAKKIQQQLDLILNRTSIKLTNIDLAGSVARGIRTGLQQALNKTPLYINDVRLGNRAAASLRTAAQNAIGIVGTGAGGGNRGNAGGGRRGGGGGAILPLGRISDNVSEFDKSLDAATARVTAFGATAAIIVGVKRALDALVGSTIEVDKALREINVLLNLNNSDLKSFGSDLFRIAKDTATSFQDVSAAALEFSRQGLSAEETLKRIKAAQNLVRLSGIDSVKAVEGLTTAINSYSKEGLTAAEITDKLAAVDAVAATSAGGLAEGVSRVGSAAADAGVSFDELLGLIASAKQITGRSESVIGNAFKTIFTRLDRSKVRDVLGGVINIEEGDNAVDILQKLAKNYDKLSRSQQAYVAEITAGVFQINQLKAILSDLGSEYSIFDRALKASANSSGIADERVKQLTTSLSDLLQIAGTNLKQGFASVGNEVFADQLREGLKTFNTSADFVNNLDPEGEGAKFGKAFLKGIGQVITGPGALTVAAVFYRLLGQVATFSVQNLKNLIGLNEQKLALEQASLKTLQQQNGAISQQAGLVGRQNGNSKNLSNGQLAAQLLAQQNKAQATPPDLPLSAYPLNIQKQVMAQRAAEKQAALQSKLRNGSLIGGFAAPFVGGAIESYLGDKTAGARQAGSIASGIGNTVGLGLTGFALGGAPGATKLPF